jgi:hypothetical protein
LRFPLDEPISAGLDRRIFPLPFVVPRFTVVGKPFAAVCLFAPRSRIVSSAMAAVQMEDITRELAGQVPLGRATTTP